MAERRYEHAGHVPAPPPEVWAVLSDVEGWPTWTPSVRRVERTGEGPLAVGQQARVLQPRLAPATWTVDTVEPGRAFTWTSGAPGVRSVADHRVEPDGDGSRVTLAIRQDGPLAPLVGLVYGRLVQRYLGQEIAGLRRRFGAGDSGG